MTQPIHVRLHPADRGIHPRLVKHTARELPGFEPPQVKVQVALTARQVSDRQHQLADLRIAAGEHPQPPVAIPSPERARLGGHRGDQRPPDWAAAPPWRLRRHDPEHVVDRVGQPRDHPAQLGRPARPLPRQLASRGPLGLTQSRPAVIVAGAQREHPHRLRRVLGAFSRQRGHASASAICAIR